MTGYFARLLWISSASFFVVNLLTGLLVCAMAPAVIRAAGRKRASSAAAFVLAVRLFPCTFALLAVVAIGVPSYLRLEPDATSEDLSFACFVAAILCLVLWTISLARSGRAAVKSFRYLRDCRNAARETDLPAFSIAALVIDGSGHSLGLAGIFRPRIVIGRDVFNALSQEQLGAAIGHEAAHASARDNLKKLLILLIPDILPLVRSRFAGLDRAWARFAEWAADDHATAGDLERSLSLAGALVAVARLGIPSTTAPLMTSLVAQSGELSLRVNRLLDLRTQTKSSSRRIALVSAGMAIVAVLMAIQLASPILHAAHELLENWVR